MGKWHLFRASWWPFAKSWVHSQFISYAPFLPWSYGGFSATGKQIFKTTDENKKQTNLCRRTAGPKPLASIGGSEILPVTGASLYNPTKGRACLFFCLKSSHLKCTLSAVWVAKTSLSLGCFAFRVECAVCDHCIFRHCGCLWNLILDGDLLLQEVGLRP